MRTFAAALVGALLLVGAGATAVGAAPRCGPRVLVLSAMPRHRIPFLGICGVSDGLGDPLHLSGFPASSSSSASSPPTTRRRPRSPAPPDEVIAADWGRATARGR
jgi:hypothetical protein